jgi:putative transposase
MSHSYSNNLIHLVFSTKERANLIDPTFEPRLYRYIYGIAHECRFMIFGIGGTANHIHLLYDLPPTMKLSDSVNLIKTNSSRFMKEQGLRFAWQKGFGAFGVSASNKARVLQYIANQKQHHRRIPFEDEFIALLKKHNVPYDPKYVFG